MVRLFPDFGERALYENWRAAESLDQVPRPSISLLDCPSDPLVRDDGPSLSYMANAGRAEDSPEYNSPEFGVFLDRVPRDYSNAIPQMTSAYLDEHGDGQGKTLLLAENIQLLLPNRQTGTRWDVADNKMSNVFVWHCTNSPTRSMRVNGDPRDRVLSPATARPASNHAGGANVAFCDQVVIFLRDDIDYRVYIQLMAPSRRAYYA